jgi:hypothetical protein
MEHLIAALGNLFTPIPFIFMLVGVTVGITVGAIPGLSGAMVIALTLPLTFFMESTNALILLVSMYVGSTSGGLISATLMRMPGTPAALMTVLDGFPMARQGRPGRALGLGIYASFIGGMVSWLFLAVPGRNRSPLRPLRDLLHGSGGAGADFGGQPGIDDQGADGGRAGDRRLHGRRRSGGRRGAARFRLP